MTTQLDATSVTTETEVDAPVEHAFRVFTEGIGSWWDPGHHILQAELAEMVFEPYAGGHIIDRGTDGSECCWARVLAYDPRTGSASAGTSTCAGSWKPTRTRLAKWRSPSPPTGPPGPGSGSHTAISTGTATAGKACVMLSAQAGPWIATPKSPHNADRRQQHPAHRPS
jgi:hypothetical protein